MRVKVSKSIPSIVAVIYRLSSAKSTGKIGTNTLSFTYLYRKESQGVKSGLLSCHLAKLHVVVHGSSNPLVRKMFIKVISHSGQPVHHSIGEWSCLCRSVTVASTKELTYPKKWLPWQFAHKKNKESNIFFLDTA